MFSLPPEGFPASDTVNAADMAEPIAHMAHATREQLGDQVRAMWATTMTRLHDLLAGVSPQEWERLCYHPWRLMPVRQFLPMTLQAASVTCHCDTETYVLVMYGRLSLEAASAVGRLRIEGEQAAVADYGQWFKGA